MTKYLDNEGLTHFTEKMKGYADGKVGAVDKKVTSHIGDTQNPHGVTKEQVGLGKVTNDAQIPSSQKGVANGVATLGADGKLTSTQMPVTKTINGESIFGTGNLTVSTSLYKIVDALPTKNIDISKIYLVPATTTADKNNKTEYIYLGDPNKAYDVTKWEKLGEEQKNATIETPGGSIVVDTAFNTSSSNPIANKTVAAKFATVDSTLNEKVAKGDYDTAMGNVNSKLKALEDKTITTDSELSESSDRPIQTQAVYKAVQGLETKINNKANNADLTAAVGRITTLENDGATGVTESGEGNGIVSIKKVGKNIVATKGTFITSLTGYVSTGTLNTTLANYVKSTELSKYYTKTEIDGKGYLTEHQSLANYATQSWVNSQNFATQNFVNSLGFAKKADIPTQTSQLKNDSGFLTEQSLTGYVNSVEVPATDMMVQEGLAVAIMRKNGSKIEYTLKPFFNTLDVEDTANNDGNGIAEISIDPTKKYILRAKKGKFITEATLGTSINDYASKQGYLTENNLNEKLKETVTIKLVSDKSASDTNLNGATVTVKSGDTTVSTQTWQGTPIKVEVPCDRDVTIEAAAVKMYIKPKALKYVPSLLYNREVTFTYKALELGVFIVDTNDNLINKDSWSPTMEQTTVGVALITEKVAIVISTGLHTDLCWSKTYQLVGGVTTTTDSTVAATDYKGKANTEAIVKALGQNAPAAYYCSNYTFKNGKKGYLMAAGEAQEIFVNMQKISELLNYINPNTTNLANGYEVWTSTQNNKSTAWRHDGMMLKTLSKTVDNNYVVPIYSLND